MPLPSLAKKVKPPLFKINIQEKREFKHELST